MPPDDDQKRNVLIYTSAVLPITETFVRDQTRALTRWAPALVGRERVAEGLDIDDLLAPEMRDLRRLTQLQSVQQRLSRRVPVLRTVAERSRPSLIHAHFLTGGFDVTASLHPLPCPVIVTAHGFDATLYGAPPKTWRPDRWLHGLLRHRLLRSPVRFVAVSDYIRDQLVQLGASPDSVRVIHTGVDCDYFHEPPAEEVRSGVLFVGRLVPKKGPKVLLEAVARLRARGIAPSVEIIGDGPLRPQLERFASDNRLDVRFRGARPRRDVRASMLSAAVLCNPSMRCASGDREGFGMVLAEAQATGMPVVAARSGGMVDAVSDGQTGFLVSEDDPRALAEALHRCLADDQLRRRLGHAARRWVLDRFDLTKQTRTLEDYYDEVASMS